MAVNPIPGEKTSGEGRNRYLETLGLKPGASPEQVHTTYFMLIKRFPGNPTEEDEARLQAIKHAYGMLRRGTAGEDRKPVAAASRRRHMVPVLGLVALLLAGAWIGLNYGEVRMRLTHYPDGTVLRLKDRSESYGKVVGFESSHRFPTGNPSAAYALRLSQGDQTIWIGERVVVNGMAPVSSSP